MEQFIKITIDVEYKDFVSKLSEIKIEDKNFDEFCIIAINENAHKLLLDKKSNPFCSFILALFFDEDPHLLPNASLIEDGIIYYLIARKILIKDNPSNSKDIPYKGEYNARALTDFIICSDKVNKILETGIEKYNNKECCYLKGCMVGWGYTRDIQANETRLKYLKMAVNNRLYPCYGAALEIYRIMERYDIKIPSPLFYEMLNYGQIGINSKDAYEHDILRLRKLYLQNGMILNTLTLNIDSIKEIINYCGEDGAKLFIELMKNDYDNKIILGIPVESKIINGDKNTHLALAYFYRAHKKFAESLKNMQLLSDNSMLMQNLMVECVMFLENKDSIPCFREFLLKTYINQSNVNILQELDKYLIRNIINIIFDYNSIELTHTFDIEF